MHRATLALALLAVTSAASASLRAQSSAAAPVAVGERVRITTPSQRGPFRYVGGVTEVRADTLMVQTHDATAPRPVAIADITRLEVSAGTHGNGGRGMLYGTVIGAGAGAIFGAAHYRKPDCAGTSFICDTGGRGADAFAGGLVGGVLGLAVGGIWGATHPSERWVPRTLGSAAHVGVIPSVRGATLTLSARF